MSNKINYKNLKINERSLCESIILLFPLFLILVILPLIVKMHTYNSGLNIYDWFTESDLSYDFFLYYKQWFFFAINSLIIIILMTRVLWLKKSLKFTKIILPIILYASLVLASTILSKNIKFGLKGNYESFENLFTLLGYVLVVYYSFCIIQSEFELKLLINALAIGSLIIGIIGTFQAFGLDIFNTPFGKSLIVEKGVDPQVLSFSFGAGRTYSTLYNPNYVGVYSALIIPLYSVLIFFSSKILDYILYSLVVITSIISLYGSQSKSGIISIGVAVFVTLLVLRRQLKKKLKFIIPSLLILVGLFIAIIFINDFSYIRGIANIFNNTKTHTPSLSSIESNNEKVTIIYKNNTLFAKIDESNNFIISDTSGNELNYTLAAQQDDANILHINDIRFENIVPIIYTKGEFLFSLYIDDKYWSFSRDNETGDYLYYNRYGRFSPIKTANSLLFDGYESFASNRGYIWSRTLPIIVNYLIIGSGADTFVQAFPQYDYVGFYNYSFSDTLITKPHSFYLQIAINTGFLSLISIVTFIIMYFKQSIKLYFKNTFESKSSVIGIGILVSVISYLISGISNDSNISVAPVFWVIVGIGLATNRINQNINMK